MGKYLDNSEIQINHIYTDSKGFDVIYLGKATQDNGYWNYPLAYIYIKKEKFLKYPDGTPLDEILNDLQEKGVRHYCFSVKPRKLEGHVGRILYPELHGKVGIFNFE